MLGREFWNTKDSLGLDVSSNNVSSKLGLSVSPDSVSFKLKCPQRQASLNGGWLCLTPPLFVPFPYVSCTVSYKKMEECPQMKGVIAKICPLVRGVACQVTHSASSLGGKGSFKG